MVSAKSMLNQEKIKYFPKLKSFFFFLISKKDFIKKTTSSKKNAVAKQNMYRTQLIYCMKPSFNLRGCLDYMETRLYNSVSITHHPNFVGPTKKVCLAWFPSVVSTFHHAKLKNFE